MRIEVEGLTSSRFVAEALRFRRSPGKSGLRYELQTSGLGSSRSTSKPREPRRSALFPNS